MVYRDSFDTGWMRFLRALQASFPVGVLFGVEVRIYWLTVILLPLIGVLQFSEWASGALEVLTHSLILTVGITVVIWAHEMGHVLAGRRYRIHTPLITISPLGGLAHMGAPPVSPRSDILISLAGPATHLLWLAVVWPLSLLVEPGLLRPASWVVSPLWFLLDLLVYINLWLMLFNLLPFLPMDGGRVLRSILSFKMHPNRATLIAGRIGIAGAVLFVVAAIGATALGAPRPWFGILLAIGISNFFACRQEMRAARYGTGPYDATPREPWESDPDAWKRAGGSASTDVMKPPGRVGRWQEKRKAKAEEKKADAAARLDEELDKVLDRVSEVGMAGLTRAEKKILERASKARRDGDR